jgi:hypothetical protein
MKTAAVLLSFLLWVTVCSGTDIFLFGAYDQWDATYDLNKLPKGAKNVSFHMTISAYVGGQALGREFKASTSVTLNAWSGSGSNTGTGEAGSSGGITLEGLKLVNGQWMADVIEVDSGNKITTYTNEVIPNGVLKASASGTTDGDGYGYAFANAYVSYDGASDVKPLSVRIVADPNAEATAGGYRIRIAP